MVLLLPLLPRIVLIIMKFDLDFWVDFDFSGRQNALLNIIVVDLEYVWGVRFIAALILIFVLGPALLRLHYVHSINTCFRDRFLHLADQR